MADCTLESGLRPHLSFSRTRALLEACRDGKGSDTGSGLSLEELGGQPRATAQPCSLGDGGSFGE